MRFAVAVVFLEELVFLVETAEMCAVGVTDDLVAVVVHVVELVRVEVAVGVFEELAFFVELDVLVEMAAVVDTVAVEGFADVEEVGVTVELEN